MNSPFNEEKFDSLLEGLEISVIDYKKIDHIKKRLDSEYYKKEYLRIDEKIKSIGETHLPTIKTRLDCSAFYPSITPYYNFKGEGVPFLRVNEIKNGLVKITKDTAFLPQHVLDDNTSTIAIGYPGDIIIAKGGNTLAKVGLITSQYEKYALSRDIILVRTNKIKNYNSYFLWLFLHSDFGQALLWRTASQTGQPHLTLKSIKEINLPKFSSNFERISEKIYLRSVELNNSSNELYNKADKLLMEHLGLQDIELSQDSVNIKNFSNSFNKSGRLDAEYYQLKYEQIVDKIKSVNHDKLSNLVKITKSIEPGSANYSEEGLPFIRVSDYDKFGLSTPDKYLTDEFCLENEDLVDELKPKKKTILFSKDGSVGTAYMLRKDADLVTSSAILHLIVKDKARVIPEYLTLALNSKLVQMQAERDAGGSIILHWRVSEVKNVVIPMLDIDKQKEIAELIEESFVQKRQSEHLLEVVKRSVEIAIEKDEKSAMEFIKSEVADKYEFAH